MNMGSEKREYLKEILEKIIERFVNHNPQFKGINFEGFIDYEKVREILDEVAKESRESDQVPDIKKFSERILHGMNHGEYFTQKGRDVLFMIQIEKSPDLLERVKESLGGEESYFYHVAEVAREAEHFIEEGHKHEAREHLKELKSLGFYESAMKHLKKREERGGELLSVNPKDVETRFNRGLAWVAAAILFISISLFFFSFSSVVGSVIGSEEKISLLKIVSSIGIVIGLAFYAFSKIGNEKGSEKGRKIR